MDTQSLPESAAHTVPFPFDDPKADIALKTSDSVEVRSYKVLLSLASPVFQSMLELPQSEDAVTQSTVEVIEDSKCLMNALRWCDHRAIPALHVQDLLEALIVADKYEMVHVIHKVQTSLCEVLKSTDARDTLRIFAIAYKLRLEELSQAAAHRTLSHSSSNQPHVEEFELIPATALHQLARYHSSFRGQIRTLLSNHTSVMPETGPLDDFCSSISSCKNWSYVDRKRALPDWLIAYLAGLKKHFSVVDENIAPLSARGAACATTVEIKMGACADCKNKIRLFIRMESEYLQWLDNTVQEVSPWLSTASIPPTKSPHWRFVDNLPLDGQVRTGLATSNNDFSLKGALFSISFVAQTPIS